MAKIFNINMQRSSIEKLISGCKKGDPNSQRLLFDQMAPILLTTCRRYGDERNTAEDLLQETFITVFDKIKMFDVEKGKFENWVKRIAINLALNKMRSQKVKFTEITTGNLEIDDQDTKLDSEVSEEEIIEFISSLPLGYKTVFNLYVFDSYSHQQIADELNISLSTSKTQFLKAKRILRQQINALRTKKFIRYGY